MTNFVKTPKYEGAKDGRNKMFYSCIPPRHEATFLQFNSGRGHLSIVGVTDSPLCRACMEADETPTHVMLECTGVTEQSEIYLGSLATIPEVLSNSRMLGFWNELGWLE
ncbi:jg21433 [Pararge aegeria aegeria]|uniref:Jg21433 protein n=1 Tax=Pararge aegeria aegeria TaxID=348720 RepID=A0A8S4R9R3_9NEOP|nr:jg21433 [Pararge aegeria aegeria]